MENKEFKTSQQKPKQKSKTRVDNWIKYSGLSIQMVVIILLGFFGGLKLDEFLQWKYPVFTVLFALLSIFIALWLVIRDFLK
ncbi:MAG: hypothetical protein B6I20_09030 [Bacteroidetes bacterium 4572_117]|nr:MAG: hypothetical protein B6I20_09030 [Bacteroidetes bacterium 4572_117]